MNKNIQLILLISCLFAANAVSAAYMGLSSPEDFTGESIIGSPTMLGEDGQFLYPVSTSVDNGQEKGTMPPIKKLRLKYRDSYKKIFTDGEDVAPVDFLREDSISAVEETSPKDEQDLVDKKQKKKSWFKRDKEVSVSTKVEGDDVENFKKEKKLSAKKEKVTLKDRVVLDCESMDYDTEKAIITAHGKVVVSFPEQGVVLYAEDVEFDKVANIIRANNKVLIKRGDLEVNGDYIEVDLNEENVLLGRPISSFNQMEINAKSANMHEGVIYQEDGSITVKKSMPLVFYTGKRRPRLENMLTKKEESSSLSEDLENGRYKIKTTKIVIDSEKEHDSLLVQKATIYKDGKKKITLPRMKFYTNKNRDYVAGDFFELGSKRDGGLFFGPGVVFKLPKGSALKAIPFVNYKDEFGIGGLLRFNSGTNETYLLYAPQHDKFIGRGAQALDDNLRIEYATNDFMNEWFMGRARPKYGISLVYDKSYPNPNFLGKSRHMTFRHRMSGGFYEDIGYDKYYKALVGTGEETYRFKYMAQIHQSIWERKNKEDLTWISLGFVAQTSAAVYGTGDTQVIGRVGPILHTQYKRWMQDVGYFQSAFQDNSPMPVFDAYRYGKSNAYLRETVKLHRLLALSWFASMTLSDDTYNNKMFQECSFYASLGPDDLKFNIGYDFVRENVYFTIAAALDAKGTEVTYDKLEIKNADKFGKKQESNPSSSNTNVYAKPKKAPVLKNAIVEVM